MTGDTHNNDDSDFLDEDFVVEDIVGKNDDLEDLFDEPAQPAAEDPADKADEDKDEDDLLFTDHTEGLDAEEQFQKPTFAEDGDSEWNGELLDLESVGEDATAVPDASAEEEEAMADPELAEAKESFASELDSMLSDEEDFALDSEADLQVVGDDGVSEFEQSGPFVLDDGEGLWSDEAEAASLEEASTPGADAFAGDDFAGDDFADLEPLEPVAEVDDAELSDEVELFDEQPLETVDPFAEEQAEETFSVAEGEAIAADANPFVNMTHELPPETFDDASEAPTMVTEGAFDELDEIVEGGAAETPAAEPFDAMPLLDATEGGEVGQPGWEPLPSASMDELSEVDEVQRADEVEYDTSGYEEDEVYDESAEGEEAYEDEYAEHEYTPEELEGVDGHDIYAEDEDEQQGVVVGGPGSHRRRSWSLVLSLAASLMIIGLAATVVVRPAWFGLRVAPEQVARVEVPRPRVDLVVPEPPKVEETVEQPVELPTETTPTETQPADALPAGTEPEGSKAADGQSGEGATQEGAPSETTSAGKQPEPLIGQNEPQGTESAQPNVADGQPQSTEGQGMVAVNTPKPEQWPVASSQQKPKVESEEETLARFGDNLLVGGIGKGDTSNGTALDGVLPGSRAFAQLHNGNYFIGKVKQIAGETITLRVETGEVTLPTIEIAQLTRLGSNDYEELQRATKGFVRLTNNNRLVGGILSKIADDHVVLEFRSNRVMLPKSAIGEIVSGEEDASVRLGTTSEEDNWLKKIAERALGNGRGAETAPKPTVPEGAVRSSPPR